MRGEEHVRLSLQTCRQLLGIDEKALSDTELESLRDQMYQLAHVVVDGYQTQRAEVRRQAAILEGMSSDQVEAIEERAAVLEFDANMSRRLANRAAVASSSHTNRSSR